jgi:hypothetical protein
MISRIVLFYKAGGSVKKYALFFLVNNRKRRHKQMNQVRRAMVSLG